jgi:hypothetical protein
LPDFHIIAAANLMEVSQCSIEMAGNDVVPTIHPVVVIDGGIRQTSVATPPAIVAHGRMQLGGVNEFSSGMKIPYIYKAISFFTT